MEVDVGRNFVTKDSILRLLDVMAIYKLNKFHFHLTDDEGWRLEIPGLPELTDVRIVTFNTMSYQKNSSPYLRVSSNVSHVHCTYDKPLTDFEQFDILLDII